MRLHPSKHFYSVIACAFFLIIAAASGKVNKISCGSFSQYNTGEDFSEKRNYVELVDGTKIYGERITWTGGLLPKDQIKIDGAKYAIKETRGYFKGGSYYGALKDGYAKRIVHGSRINVYYTEDMHSNTSIESDGRTKVTRSTVCLHYAQKDNGPLEPIANKEDIQKLVADCPAAYALVDEKDKVIRKAIRKDPMYLNNVFITYNNCGKH